MFIGFLQDLSDIVLIYMSGPVDLEAVRTAKLEPRSFKCSFGSALPIAALGGRFKRTVGRWRTEPVTPGWKECGNNTTMIRFSTS